MQRTLVVFLAFFAAATALVSLLTDALAQRPARNDASAVETNLALVATPSASFVSGDQTLAALNDGYTPRNSQDRARGSFGNWPRTGSGWVEYTFSQPISTNRVDVYWHTDQRGLRAPASWKLKYWDGNAYVDVREESAYELELNRFNSVTFAEVSTKKLRLEFESAGTSSVGMLEWKVIDTGKSPAFAPLLAGLRDRIVVGKGQTWLNPTVKGVGAGQPTFAWTKEGGPGNVTFVEAQSAATSATFDAPGEYTLRLTAKLSGEASAAGLSSTGTLRVSVEAAPPEKPLEVVDTKAYTLDSPLWNDRIKVLIVGWIPHCYTQLSNLELREGGINNFIQAANKLQGKPYTSNSGYPFTDAYVHNTIEAMCLALLIDPGNDAEIKQAQEAIREKLEEWIPLVLAAQEPDGYLQTRFTRDRRNAGHWTIRGDHEGYVAGYFLEAAIAHYRLTAGKDRRLYDAACRMADCWDNNLGPAPKRTWYDGHEEMEHALVRFARLVDEVEGKGKGDKYIALSKFLMDCRRSGQTYDQSHVPVVQQYESVGHAVRAVYLYTAMSEVGAITNDPDYQSATRSLWDNVVNRKYYVTGGVGSGETSEGFGNDYSLRNNAYCESCSSCGEIYFQNSMCHNYHDARYADLAEQTIYNALLGSVSIDGKLFNYTNGLDERASTRTTWHVCPCCVGNIPRTLLQLPTWMYAKSADGIYVNLFVGGSVTVENVGGTNVRMVQKTDYPWSGDVEIGVHPDQDKTFTVRVRVPNRDVSTLYSATPTANGINSIAVNGTPLSPAIVDGYALVTRAWKAGDKIQLSLPMPVQRVHASDKIANNRGRVALRIGPVVYNIESVDQDLNQVLPPDAPLATEWRGDLLHGTRVITGQFADGKPLLAVPNYARNNRGDRQSRSIVWIRER